MIYPLICDSSALNAVMISQGFWSNSKVRGSKYGHSFSGHFGVILELIIHISYPYISGELGVIQ